jgi:hypothetical protein
VLSGGGGGEKGGRPLADATVSLVAPATGKPVRTTADGEFWRLLPPGEYTVKRRKKI